MKGFGCLFCAIALLAYSATASSVEVKNFTCTATHHSIDSSGNDDAMMVGRNIKLTDIGTSFTVTIGNKKFHSTSLIPISKNGKTALVGKDGETYYTKLDDSYVIHNKDSGYVISECH